MSPVGPSGNAVFLFGSSTNNGIYNDGKAWGRAGCEHPVQRRHPRQERSDQERFLRPGRSSSTAPITADVAGGTITFNGSSFTNNGSIEAAAGNITLNTINFVNNGVLKASGGVLTVGSSVNFTNNPTSSLINTGGTFTFNNLVSAPSLGMSAER